MFLDKITKWIRGEERAAREAAGKLLRNTSIGRLKGEQGDRDSDIDGSELGGVVWPLDGRSHDAISFLSRSIFLAEYVRGEGVYMMEGSDLETRHLDARVLQPGDDIHFLPGMETEGHGFVVRSSQFGTEGLYQNFFIPMIAALKAHHLPEDQPKNSSQVFDEDGRHAGIHTQWRVREWVENLCGPKTSSSFEKYYAPLLNMGTNGDGTAAFGASHWNRAEGTLSDEGGGFAAPADDGNHRLGVTSESQIHQGGLNITKTLHGDTAGGIIYSPAQFFNVQWESGSKGPFVKPVEWREDFLDRHQNHCGVWVPGKKKWQSWADRTIYENDPGSVKKPADPGSPPNEPQPSGPTTGLYPDTPQEDPGRDVKVPAPPESVKQGDPGGIKDDDPGGTKDPGGVKTPTDPGDEVKRQGDPAHARVPYEGPRPSSAGPAEDESPSRYGHPRPGIPDDPGPTDWPSGGHSDSTPNYGFWVDTFGFDEVSWLRVPMTSHTVEIPVYRSDAPLSRGTPADRWPEVKSAFEQIFKNPDGSVAGRRPALGPGSIVDLPANLIDSNIFARNDHLLNVEPDDFARIVGAFQTASGVELDGRFGIGRRALYSPFVASGIEFRLDHGGGDSSPNVIIEPKDEEAVPVLDYSSILSLNYQTRMAGLLYPKADGNDGEALVTDGSGTLSFADVSSDPKIKRIRKEVQITDLQALGSVTEGWISMDTSVPSEACILFAQYYNNGIAITGEDLTQLAGQITANGQAIGFTTLATFLNLSDRRVRSPGENAGSDPTELPFGATFTPHIRFQTVGGTLMANLEGDDASITVDLWYTDAQ